MKTVMFCLNPFLSHVIPIFEFANRLKQKHTNVIFIGPTNFREPVLEKNFEYICIYSYNDNILQELKRKKDFLNLENAYRKIHLEIKEAFISSKIDIAFIGVSRFLVYFLPAQLLSIKTIFYSLNMGATEITCYNPPITCGYIPSNNILSKFICLYLWGRRALRKITDITFFLQFKFYPWKQLKQLSKDEKWKWKFGIDGIFPDFPIIVIGTRFLEFNSHNRVLHTGLCVEKISSPVSEKYPISDALVYCSLGTMASRYKNGYAFINTVIHIFCKNPQWRLVISLGGISKDKLCLKDLPINITVYDFAPQREILQYASLVLTHGGHGTIKECVEARVPMIVFPCSYDQHGNAARVVYHGIGLRSTILKKTFLQRVFNKNVRCISSKKIVSLINEVLENPKYRLNIERLHNNITSSKEMEDIVYYICTNEKWRSN